MAQHPTTWNDSQQTNAIVFHLISIIYFFHSSLMMIIFDRLQSQFPRADATTNANAAANTIRHRQWRQHHFSLWNIRFASLFTLKFSCFTWLLRRIDVVVVANHIGGTNEHRRAARRVGFVRNSLFRAHNHRCNHSQNNYSLFHCWLCVCVAVGCCVWWIGAIGIGLCCRAMMRKRSRRSRVSCVVFLKYIYMENKQFISVLTKKRTVAGFDIDVPSVDVPPAKEPRRNTASKTEPKTTPKTTTKTTSKTTSKTTEKSSTPKTTPETKPSVPKAPRDDRKL